MTIHNLTVRRLATRSKDRMYALAFKVNVDCDLLIASRVELISRVGQCFENILVAN